MFRLITNVHSIVKRTIQIKNGTMIHANGTVWSIVCTKKIIAGKLTHVFVRMVQYLKSINETSVIVCNEIINVMDSVTIKVTNTIPTNVMSTVSMNSHDKK